MMKRTRDTYDTFISKLISSHQILFNLSTAEPSFKFDQMEIMEALEHLNDMLDIMRKHENDIVLPRFRVGILDLMNLYRSLMHSRLVAHENKIKDEVRAQVAQTFEGQLQDLEKKLESMSSIGMASTEPPNPPAPTESHLRFIRLTDSNQKIPVIKLLREYSNLGLKESKDIAETSRPIEVFPRDHNLERCTKSYQAMLEQAGCIVEIVYS